MKLVSLTNSPKEGIRVIVYGDEKVGKTTLGLTVPKPVILQVERGVNRVEYEGVMTFDEHIDSTDDVAKALEVLKGMVKSGKAPFESIVIDSLSEYESLAQQELLLAEKNDSATMMTAVGGFGKAFDVVARKMFTMKQTIDELSAMGINVFIICHAITYKANLRGHGEVTRSDIAIHSPKNDRNPGAREYFTKQADMIMHVGVATTEEGLPCRLLTVVANDFVKAGNRYHVMENVMLPPVKPGDKLESWNYVADAIFKCSGLDYFKR